MSRSPRKNLVPGINTFQLPPGGLPPIVRPPEKALIPLQPQDAKSLGAGHEAFAAAAVWLGHASTEGRHSIERRGHSQTYSFAGELGAEHLKVMPPTARRLIVASGALTARELRKAGKAYADIFEPLSQQERELKVIMQKISEKAAQKFGTVRQALRHLDADCDGTVDRSEIRYFFRAYDFDERVADKFFDYMDVQKKGEIDYADIVNFLRPFVEGAVNGHPMTARDLTSTKGKSDAFFEEACGQPDADIKERLGTDFEEVLCILGRQAGEKFGSVRKCFRKMDTNRNGFIQRAESRYFFRLFNLPMELADRFHDALDVNGSGEISFQEFSSVLGPYIQSDEPLWSPPARDPTPEFEKRKPTKLCVEENGADGDARQEDPSYSAVIGADVRTELRVLMQDMGEKLPLKFKHVRDAFRPLDVDRIGTIKRGEMRAFFRGFGHGEETADRVFNLLDPDGSGQVDFAGFMKHFDRVLGPAFRQARRAPFIPVKDPDVAKEVTDVAIAVSERLITKYKNIQEAFRALDLNKDGKVSPYEMRVFLKKFGIGTQTADTFFHALDMDMTGYITYNEFILLFGGIHRGEDVGSPKVILNRLS